MDDWMNGFLDSGPMNNRTMAQAKRQRGRSRQSPNPFIHQSQSTNPELSYGIRPLNRAYMKWTWQRGMDLLRWLTGWPRQCRTSNWSQVTNAAVGLGEHRGRYGLSFEYRGSSTSPRFVGGSVASGLWLWRIKLIRAADRGFRPTHYEGEGNLALISSIESSAVQRLAGLPAHSSMNPPIRNPLIP